ncbi:ABC transporter permease [Vagococcus humatus]|uniref:ABC transporter permease n=1 Tax=Vagococcus humatus TaxID=1889241 RepID=A0A3R9YE91_9ENTE|nr:ABC transporter permease [Vagococcus humatus]RST89252.1 ABC transporter permease [Vagococcus humatus]
MEQLLSILHTTLRMTTPIALAALGGLYAHRAGVLNVALEGMMLASAFFGVITSFATGNIFLALFVGILASVVLGFVFSFFGITLKGNLTIVGLAINTLVAGASSFILQVVFGQRGTFANQKIVGLKELDIPILRNIPILGDIFNKHTPIVYLSLLVLVVVHFILYHTKLGVYIRTVGEKEDAAVSVGLPVNKLRYISVLIGSVLCGLAGINIALENVTMFVENMTGGRGFIALAAIYSGRGTAIGTYVFSLLFGFADAMQIRMQNIKIPGAFIQMIPYLSIIVVLSVIGLLNKRSRRVSDDV